VDGGMTKRITNEFWAETPWFPDIRVFEEEQSAVDTGLLDGSGAKIYRRPMREPIGFDLTPRRK
jgi:hypothetical protein